MGQTEEYKTIRELLIAASYRAPYAVSANSKVYEIPGFPDYLLRSPSGIFSEDGSDPLSVIYYDNTTYLYPAYLCNLKLGQVRLQSKIPFTYTNFHDSLQIISKLDGKSLWELYREYRDKHDTVSLNRQYFLAGKEFMDFLIHIPDAVFEQWMSQLNELTGQGITADINLSNILWDEKKQQLNIVDTYCFRGFDRCDRNLAKNNLEEFLLKVTKAGVYKPAAIENKEEYQAYKESEKLLTEKLVAIAHKVNFPVTQREAADALKSRKIAFRNVRRIEELGRISLEDSPAQLRKMLNDINAYEKQQTVA